MAPYKTWSVGAGISYNLVKHRIVEYIYDAEEVYGQGYYVGYTERKFGFKTPLYERYPQYNTLTARRESFKNWSPELAVKIKHFADAGFCFMGERPYLICFARGCPLWNWTVETDPWKAHYKVNPFCPVIRVSKGYNFHKKEFPIFRPRTGLARTDMLKFLTLLRKSDVHLPEYQITKNILLCQNFLRKSDICNLRYLKID